MDEYWGVRVQGPPLQASLNVAVDDGPSFGRSDIQKRLALLECGGTRITGHHPAPQARVAHGPNAPILSSARCTRIWGHSLGRVPRAPDKVDAGSSPMDSNVPIFK